MRTNVACRTQYQCCGGCKKAQCCLKAFGVLLAHQLSSPCKGPIGHMMASLHGDLPSQIIVVTG